MRPINQYAASTPIADGGTGRVVSRQWTQHESDERLTKMPARFAASDVSVNRNSARLLLERWRNEGKIRLAAPRKRMTAAIWEKVTP